MALLMFEGFDSWSGNPPGSMYAMMGSNGTGIWDLVVANFNFFPGTLGGKMVGSISGGSGRYNLGAVNTNTCIVGFRLQMMSPFSAEIFNWLDSAGAIQCGLSLNASSKIIFWRGTSATILGTSATSIVALSDYYIECKVPFGNSVNVEIRINGVTEISLTGVDTTNTANLNWQYIALKGSLGSQYHYFDDLYLCDSSGSAPHNDFLGGLGAAFTGIRVETLFPTTNNSVTWTPNASTNVSRVQETAMDSDTTYNSTVTNGAIDTYNHGALSATPTTVFCVKVQSLARKEDVPVQSYRNKFISGATTSNGATRILTTVYQGQEDYYLNDPNTAAAWTTANINATKIGYENV